MGEWQAPIRPTGESIARFVPVSVNPTAKFGAPVLRISEILWVLLGLPDGHYLPAYMQITLFQWLESLKKRIVICADFT
jgi:hypothetical protein